MSCLGHAHPQLVQAIATQAARVIHTSNIYEIPQQAELAARLTALAGMQEAAFANSGSEANEAAIKLARYYAWQRGNQHAHIITMDSSWHGRTLATLAATGSDKARKGFEPLPSGFIQVPYNQIDAVRAAATPSRAWRRSCLRRCRAKAASGRRTPPTCRRCASSVPSAAGC